MIFSEKYPPKEQYETLYARFFTDDGLKRLLDVAGPLEGKKVLDLCAGGHRLSLEIVKQNPDYIATVEQEPEMLPPTFLKAGRCVIDQDPVYNSTIYLTSVERFLGSRYFPPIFDVVFCQQAVNYWLTPKTAEQLSYIMKPDALFVFNTFIQCPPIEPMTREYEHQGRKYTEITWFHPDSGMIHHVQITPEFPPHTTSFMWISGSDYVDMLYPHFRFEYSIIPPGMKSVTYRCVKI